MSRLDKARKEQYRRPVAESFPDRLEMPGFTKRLGLRYGQNPGGPAALYIEDGASGNMASFEIVQPGTKPLGYINVADMDLGQRLILNLTTIFPDKSSYVIVKHEIPAGVGLGQKAEEAFDKAW